MWRVAESFIRMFIMSLTEFTTLFEQLDDCELAVVGKVSAAYSMSVLVDHLRHLHVVGHDALGELNALMTRIADEHAYRNDDKYVHRN